MSRPYTGHGLREEGPAARGGRSHVMRTNGTVARARRRHALLTMVQLALISLCQGRCFAGTGLLGFQEITLSMRSVFSSQYPRQRRKWHRWEVSDELPTLFCAREKQHEEQEACIKNDTEEEERAFPFRSICIAEACIVDSPSDFRNQMDFSVITADLATQLSVPMGTDPATDSYRYSHALVVLPYQVGNMENYAVAIQSLSHDIRKSRRRRTVKKPTSQPFFVDFCPPSSSRLGQRFEGQSGTDLLIKAVSPSKSGQGTKGAVVYDLTAGFGQDSLLMLQGGAAHVHMVERDPIVAALLFDGLRRLRLIAANGDSSDLQTQRAIDLSDRLTLEETRDAVEVAKNTLSNPSSVKPDVCYVDPMFPTRTKSAAVKKNMQILHGLLGSQANDGAQNEKATKEELDLLEAAWSLASKRVVVKRPISADYLGGSSEGGLKPSYAIKGSVNRWDVYVKQ